MSETYTTDSAEALAEVLAKHPWWPGSVTDPLSGCYCGWRHEPPGVARDQYVAHVAETLAPLLGEFQAEDEARGAARVREAVEAAIREHGQQQIAGHVWTRDDYLRAALDGAEKAAVEPASVPTSEREGGNGPDHAGTSVRPADRRTAAQEGE